MKITISQDEEKLIFLCKGKLKTPNLFQVKRLILSSIQEYPNLNTLSFSLDSFPIDLPLLGFLLTLSHSKRIEILISNYSNFRMLEDLYLLTKFNVKYQKVN